jgi:transcriptional regulator with XRE-family HTH domain
VLSIKIIPQIFSVRILSSDILATISIVDKNLVGSRIKKARKIAKPEITQLDLVARLQSLGLSVDQSTLSKIENGQRPVTDIEIAALAKALRVSVSWLFDEANKSPSPSSNSPE